MAYSPKVFADGPIVDPGTKLCDFKLSITAATTLTTNNIAIADNCYENKATIELNYEDKKTEVKVDRDLLKHAESYNLTLTIIAKDSDGNELYTATLTPKAIDNPEYYNVTVWLEKLTDENTISTLKDKGYNGVAYLRAIETEAPILNATYEFNTKDILNDGDRSY